LFGYRRKPITAGAKNQETPAYITTASPGEEMNHEIATIETLGVLPVCLAANPTLVARAAAADKDAHVAKLKFDRV
jgi:hypothetical protein